MDDENDENDVSDDEDEDEDEEDFDEEKEEDDDEEEEENDDEEEESYMMMRSRRRRKHTDHPNDHLRGPPRRPYANALLQACKLFLVLLWSFFAKFVNFRHVFLCCCDV